MYHVRCMGCHWMETEGQAERQTTHLKNMPPHEINLKLFLQRCKVMRNIILMTRYEYAITEEAYTPLVQITSSFIKKFQEPLDPFMYKKCVCSAKRGAGGRHQKLKFGRVVRSQRASFLPGCVLCTVQLEFWLCWAEHKGSFLHNML